MEVDCVREVFQMGVWIVFILLASYFDIRYRMVPDWLNLGIAACSLLGFQRNPAGILCAVPFFLAAVCWGGIGGGDIKFMAACGICLGIYKGLAAAILGTIALLVFHSCNLAWSVIRKRHVPSAYPMIPFLAAACIAMRYV